LSAINAAIVLKAIEILQQDHSAIDKLFANASYAKTNIVKKAWIPTHNDYPFVSIKIGSTLRTQKIVEYLFEQNILVSGLCYPNTPEGAALIRINISARHTEKQIDRLIETLEDAFREIK
jgi:7-keto-8-aminopelargonate synthetase-like enzyme